MASVTGALGGAGALPAAKRRPRRGSARVKAALALAGLLCLLAAQGYGLTRSPLWAAPFLVLLVLSLAPELPLVRVVGAALVVRVLTSEALSSPRAQYSTSLNLSAMIALLFILLAAGLIVRRRRNAGFALAAACWLAFFTLLAAGSHGAATLTFREGVREASILAVAVIVWNARGAFTVARAVRIVQLAGAGAAVLALYQLVTHSGLNIEGKIRSNGTFTHPNGAAMYFAIAATASLWRYLDAGRSRLDAALVVLFAAATISTFCVGGLACLLVMLCVLGLLRPGARGPKLGAVAFALLVMAAFALSPVGAARLAEESGTSLKSSETRGTANSSLAWRFYKWRTLIPEWERAPLLGQGLGTTVTAEGTSENVTAGKVPHNEYVRYLVETGALGLVSVLIAIGAIFVRLRRRRRAGDPANVATLGLAILAGCVLNGFGDNTLLYSTTGYAAALILAAVFTVASSTSARSVRCPAA